MNVEARSLDAGSVGRRCVLARLVDLTPSHYHRLVTQGAAALLILLPANITALTEEHHMVICLSSLPVSASDEIMHSGYFYVSIGCYWILG